MLLRDSRYIMARGVNCMASMLFIPLTEVGRLVHVLDDLTPTNARVVSAERNFALLSAVGNHAHLSATEIIVEEILKPHALDAEDAPDVVGSVLDCGLHPI